MSLKNTAAGCDDIPIRLLQCTVQYIDTALADVINLCLQQGFFLNKLKMSKIIPIHKTDAKDI